jgi:hypothetical protein
MSRRRLERMFEVCHALPSDATRRLGTAHSDPEDVRQDRLSTAADDAPALIVRAVEA